MIATLLLALAACRGGRSDSDDLAVEADPEHETGTWWAEVPEGLDLQVTGRGIEWSESSFATLGCQHKPGTDYVEVAAETDLQESFQLAVCAVTDVSASVYAVDGAIQTVECTPAPSWMATWHPGPFRSGWPNVLTRPMDADEQLACPMDVQLDDLLVVARFTCPFMRAYGEDSTAEPMALTGTIRCTAVVDDTG
jgi:hypothetical protein